MGAIRFSLLGQIEAWLGPDVVDLGHQKQRHVLAALLVDADRVVPVARILERVWGEDPPRSAQTTLYSYLSRLRRALPSESECSLIERHPGGYVARIDPDLVDLHRFRRLVAQAKATPRPAAAAEVLEQALGLWRGEPFDGTDSAWFTAQRTTLHREHAVARLDLGDLLLRCGRDADALAVASACAADDPLDERAAGHLALALHRLGRKADALACLDRTRRLLADELGVDPGAALVELRARVLADDPELLRIDSGGGGAEPSAAITWSAPATLPPDVLDFTDRAGQPARLVEQSITGGRVVAVVGMGGVGKTSLVRHVANRVADRFPDGQLWVDLGDAKPGDVLARLLRVLGVPDRAIPADPAERGDVFRTLLRGRTVLIVLDNAMSAQQVYPLLPGTGTCAVLITSRAKPTGAEGVECVELDVFTPDEGVALLTKLVGAQRVAAEPAAAERIVALCGGLPLAVRIAGARLAARRTWRLEHMVAQLRDECRRLDQLAVGDLEVRASLALSYADLAAPARRLLRLLGLIAVPDFPPWVVAVLLELPLDEAVGHAEALVDAHLLTVSEADPVGQYRYRCHDLVRLFAAERVTEEETPDERAHAVERALGGWLAIAERMAEFVPGPCYARISGSAHRPPIDGLVPDLPREWSDAWFDAERPALLAAVRQACRSGLVDLAFDLAGCLEKYFDLRGMYSDWRALNSEVLDVCVAHGHRLGEAVMRRGLLDVTTWIAGGSGEAMGELRMAAVALWELFTELGHDAGAADVAVMHSWSSTAAGRHADAVATAEAALAMAERAGHVGGRARAELALAVAHHDSGEFTAGIRHAERALVHARELGNPRWEATALQFAGIGYREAGEFEVSGRLLDQSLSIARAHRDCYTEVLTLLASARLHLRGDRDRACADAERALALSRRYRMTHHTAEGLELLGLLALAENRPHDAVTHLEESVALWRTRGWHSYHAAALESLGRAYEQVDPAAARRAFAEARAVRGGAGHVTGAFQDRP
ncbi:BTAD domain-containing putative transcriptional regulator [Actinokineospora sp. UTMC 2448]|uniref:AfsR/SARP family transcriptional regulator n=1 Tax=Actinokineospora sp. UTMC 2448 TaxID=2268449 RepID=UPI002164B473|nr:BTAD domain-containing putative transcriptional regulator [Actinokineospora sp. UTMC 2448]UVS78534.1 Regulatory protein AfsR [Actinokineospora sp. UTMC 2448]